VKRLKPAVFARAALLAACLALTSAPVSGQSYRFNYDPVVMPDDLAGKQPFPGTRFTFARLRYTDWRGGWRWQTDYPESDYNFSLRLSELTTIEVNRDERGDIVHVTLDLLDERLFEYPFVYMVEVGYLTLSDPEAANLRDYLLRGGFLHVDDFWGEYEWDNWERQVRKVFPDENEYPIVEVPLDHEIYNCVFELDEPPQVPSIYAWERFRSASDRPGMGLRPHCRGIFDKDGRLMVVMTFNTDLGDGWEREGENYEYFQKFSVARAYPMGVNIVVYALTH